MNSNSDLKKLRIYTISIAIIIIGIIALVIAAVISLMKSASSPLLICEAVVLACLVGTLIAMIFARKSTRDQAEKIRLNPYANVDKKEIDKVLDMISREEVRRKRSEDFAAGITPNSSSSSDTEVDTVDEDELRFLVIDDHENENENDNDDENSPLPIVFPDKDEYEGSSDNKSENDNAEKVTTSADPEIEAEEKEDDDMNRGYDDYDDRAPRRRSQDGADRRERDPYYDDYYDDRSRQYAGRDRDMRDPYAARDRDGVYYNEYGEPVRRRRPAYDPYYDDYYADRPRQRSARDPRDMRSSRDPYGRDPYASRDRSGVYYNEYGEPVRRRPAASPYDDPDRRQGAPRRRRPDGYPDNRGSARYDSRYEDEAPRRAAPMAPEIPVDNELANTSNDSPASSAPVETKAAAPKSPDYDENYVPVVIPDDDYDYDSAQSSHSGRAGVGSLHRPEAPKNAPAQSSYRNDPVRADDRRYSPNYDDESIPVALPDDDYFENRYSADRDPYARDPYRQTPPPPPPQTASSGRTRDRYVPDYEDEEMVISLPRDDEYENYLEKKREEEEQRREAEALAEQQRLKEQKKAERIASGKVVLTIVKIRRRKIRRKSRKYKQFRASVNHLNDYLHSFSAKNKK